MLKAVIFDLDGVLVDSEPLHFAAIKAALGDEGISLTPEIYVERYLTYDDRSGLITFFADRGLTLSEERLQELAQKKASSYEQMISSGKLRLYPGVQELIPALARRFPLAIATGSRREEVEAILRSHGLRSHFTAVVSADDVIKGKPDPESFLLALALINAAVKEGGPIQPSECVVIEDSRLSISGVRSAGMKCIAVTTSYLAEELGDADLILSALSGLSILMIEKLF